MKEEIQFVFGAIVFRWSCSASVEEVTELRLKVRSEQPTWSLEEGYVGFFHFLARNNYKCLVSTCPPKRKDDRMLRSKGHLLEIHDGPKSIFWKPRAGGVLCGVLNF